MLILENFCKSDCWGEGCGTKGEPLNDINLGQTITDPIKGMKTITKYFPNSILGDIWDLISLGQFDLINNKELSQ